MSYEHKTYTYKVYSNGGESFLAVWAEDVISLPAWSNAINSMAGQLRVRLAREFKSFGEGEDVALGNWVDLYCYDKEYPNGQLLYKGYISSYQPSLQSGSEYIDIVILPLFQQTNGYILQNDLGETKVVYNSIDPSTMMRNIFENWIDQGAKYVTLGVSLWNQFNWNEQTWNEQRPLDINTTNTTASYTFNTNTILEAFEKVVELAPANWFYRVEANGTILFADSQSGTKHDVFIGKDIIDLSYQQRSEDVVNEIYFVGGGSPQLYKKYQRTGSINANGTKAIKYIDGRVTSDATADTIANKILDEKENPEIRINMQIVDSNGQDGGYDIESIRVGDLIRVKNIGTGTETNTMWNKFSWNEGFWNYSLQNVIADYLLVVKTTYNSDSITIETSSRFPEVSKRIEDINRNQVNIVTKDNPALPS